MDRKRIPPLAPNPRLGRHLFQTPAISHPVAVYRMCAFLQNKNLRRSLYNEQQITRKEYPLSKVFDADFEYHIPGYQRPYAWTEEEMCDIMTPTNRNLWRNNSELYYNGNMDWNMDISEITSNGTYYFCRCYDYRSGY